MLSDKHFANSLLQWYSIYGRDLPWRNTDNPYIIWLSEVILQQTRVAQGLPYFEKFLSNYPNVQNLANAPSDEIMRHWQGLGYYSRARNLHQCAIDVVKQHHSQFPNSYNELLKLKGIGNYTAAAIASFAFGERVAVVDGNVFRVLSRFFGIATAINSPNGKKEFENIANRIIPIDNPGEFNQAIMEFGSLQCKPKNPDCLNCVLNEDCYALKHGLIDSLPVKQNKIKIRERFFTYMHIVCGGLIVVRKRTKGDIWQGLYDFPLTETINELIQDPQESSHVRELGSFQPFINFSPEKKYKHLLTHQRIFASFISLEIDTVFEKQLGHWADNHGFLLVDAHFLERVGKPRLVMRFLNGEK